VSPQPKPPPEPTAVWRKTPRQVVSEIKKAKLTPDEGTKLALLMTRFASGRTLRADHRRLSGGVEELRLQGHRRTFRLYFARIDGGLALLPLHFKIKKVDNDKVAKALAADRLKMRPDLRDEA